MIHLIVVLRYQQSFNKTFIVLNLADTVLSLTNLISSILVFKTKKYLKIFQDSLTWTSYFQINKEHIIKIRFLL